MASDYDIIKNALHAALGTHGEPCGCGQGCVAVKSLNAALEALERLRPVPRPPIQDPPDETGEGPVSEWGPTKI